MENQGILNYLIFLFFRYLNSDLKSLIELHTHNALEKLSGHKASGISSNDDLGINIDQKNLMISALEINKTTARELMINIENVYMMDYDHPIGKKELADLLERGFSRIPVYEYFRTNFLGVLRIKQLIGINFNLPKSLRELNIKLKMPLIIDPTMKIYDILGEFRKGKSHMAILTEGNENVSKVQNIIGNNWRTSMSGLTSIRPSNQHSENTSTDNENPNPIAETLDIEGILTLEDVIENIIKVKILDEDDYERVKKSRKRKSSNLKKLIYLNIQR